MRSRQRNIAVLGVRGLEQGRRKPYSNSWKGTGPSVLHTDIHMLCIMLECRVSYLEGHDAVDLLVVGGEHLVQLDGLLHGAGESIQDEAVLALVGSDGVTDDSDDDLVGNKTV